MNNKGYSNVCFTLILFLIIGFSFSSKAVCTLTAKCTGGNWDAAATWSPSGCGATTTPTDGCIIVIPACATVVVNINSPNYINMEIYVSGTLQFDNGQKINMCPGYIQVNAGGQLTGGTPGSKINICGSTVWNGGTTSTGPLSFGGGTTLPIELVSFDAKYNSGHIDVSWSTASENNNDYFTIQKSKDGLLFESIAEIDGAGNSSSMLNYTAKDLNPYPGTSYYRLKQTDFDGYFTYSEIKTVTIDNLENLNVLIFPNR